MAQVNFLAVLVAAASAFFLGGLWYSSALFGKIWAREAGVSYDQPKKGHGAIVFAVSFLFSVIAATVFALFLGRNPALNTAVRDGLAIGACWVATSFGINYQFANRTFKLFLIDAGYHVAQFTLYGVILGLWH
ncbi:MAG: DUF1761 domain-containing protein [Acidobacteria bacterium]|nr:DUF1761 domain-containing protein [Acidobacteriota bacterium]